MKKVKVNPRLLFFQILLGQCPKAIGPLVPEKIFKVFFFLFLLLLLLLLFVPYVGMVIILVMWVRCCKQTSIPPIHGGSV